MTDAILIIGGGVAGINAALNAAKYGIKVYLTDDTASIGGMMARLDKTFPTNDCSICIEAPQMFEVDNHEKKDNRIGRSDFKPHGRIAVGQPYRKRFGQRRMQHPGQIELSNGQGKNH